jgi:hypothetical protein
MSNQIPNRIEAHQLAKAREAAAKLQEAAAILRSLQKDANGYSLKETFGHFAAEVEQVLSVDDDQAGLLPWLKSEGG